MRFYLLPFLAIVLSASQTGARPETGTLHGVVCDPAGAILAGAVVLIQDWESTGGNLNHPVPLMKPLVYTDSEGRFSVELAPDVYDVFVSFPVFSPSAVQVKIEAGKVKNMKCDLRPSPFAKYIY